jgi:hypothetical protein
MHTLKGFRPPCGRCPRLADARISIAGQDGINLTAGTGSIAYGEFKGRTARAGGWGELFSDAGSAYWIAREGLNLFSRMSDGRTPRGLLYDAVRRHFELQSDLDLCAAIYEKGQMRRSHLAALSMLIADASDAGDAQHRRCSRGRPLSWRKSSMPYIASLRFRIMQQLWFPTRKACSSSAWIHRRR